MRKPQDKDEVSDAIFHLRLIQHGGDLIEIYRKLFPDDFGLRGVDYSSADTVLACCDRLIYLLDKHHFPCVPYSDHYWAHEEGIYTDPGWALSSIPVWFGSRNWQDRYPEELTGLEKMILTVTCVIDLDATIPKPRPGSGFSIDRLRELCEVARGGRIRDLPTVVEAITGNTGVPWVDMSSEDFAQAELPDWDLQAIKYMTEDFAEAKKIWAIVDKFEKWVNAKPCRMESVKRLLLEARIVEKQRVRVGAGRPLVEILGAQL